MIDYSFIEKNRDRIEKSLKMRGDSFSMEEIDALSKKRKELQKDHDEKKAQLNLISKEMVLQKRSYYFPQALAMDPTMVLLDEVMAGLNQSEVDEMIGLIRRLHQRGLTLLIIEHNLKVVRSFAERVIVLDRGVKIAEGKAEAILSSPEVVKAYLGDRRK